MYVVVGDEVECVVDVGVVDGGKYWFVVVFDGG